MSEGMLPDGPDAHPLMAELYDLENPWSASDDFFLAVAARRPRSRLADVGCGTGTLTVALARAGHDVTGVEPNAAFLDAAKAKAKAKARADGDGERALDVRWVHGTATDLPPDAFDVVLLTGHVAQAFVDDEEWRQLLADLHRALVPGGLLAFDSRDPATNGWEAWAGGHEGELSAGHFTSRSVILAVDGDIVTFEVDTHLPDGERRHGTSRYRFRRDDVLRADLEVAGFVVEEVHGGWHGEVPGEGEAGELVYVATRRPA